MQPNSTHCCPTLSHWNLMVQASINATPLVMDSTCPAHTACLHQTKALSSEWSRQ